MKLTREQYELILFGLRSDATDRHGAEKRVAPRVGLRVQLEIGHCASTGPGRPESVWVRNISDGGIGLCSHVPLPVGGRFLVRLPGVAGDVLTLVYQVVHCHAQTGSLYHIGARFVGTPSAPKSNAGAVTAAGNNDRGPPPPRPPQGPARQERVPAAP